MAAPQRELPVPRGCVTTTDFTKIRKSTRDFDGERRDGGERGRLIVLAEGVKPSPVLGWRPAGWQFAAAPGQGSL